VFDYHVLAANRTATLQTEMNADAAKGYQYSQFVGGETSFGGQELVVAMRPAAGSASALKTYRVIAASSTSDLEKKLTRAGEDGFSFKGTRRFHDGSGTEESVCIMERDESALAHIAYKILATARTSTMQKELQTAGQDGFVLWGITLSQTRVGVSEVVAILSK